VTQRTSAQPRYSQTTAYDDGEEEDGIYTTHLPKSAVRHRPLTQDEQALAIAQQQAYGLTKQGARTVMKYQGRYTADDPALPINQRRPTAPVAVEVPRTRSHQWFPFALGMLATLVLIVAALLGTTWITTLQDDWHYGRPRTYQVDMMVGHNDSKNTPSHFIAVNLHRHVVVMECPAGDCTHEHIYAGPDIAGIGDELTPVTLLFEDVTGNGKLDMIICVGQSRFVFINDKGTFRPLQASDHVTIK
jgi:hypothetical protein